METVPYENLTFIPETKEAYNNARQLTPAYRSGGLKKKFLEALVD